MASSKLTCSNYGDGRVIDRVLGTDRLPSLRRGTNVLLRLYEGVLSAGHEMTPARNAVGAHGQDFVVKDELLPSQKHSYSVHAHYMLREILELFSVCIVQQSVAPISSSSVFPAPRHTPLPPRGYSRGLCFTFSIQRPCGLWGDVLPVTPTSLFDAVHTHATP